jgi:hypothetical protein
MPEWHAAPVSSVVAVPFHDQPRFGIVVSTKTGMCPAVTYRTHTGMSIDAKEKIQ